MQEVHEAQSDSLSSNDEIRGELRTLFLQVRNEKRAFSLEEEQRVFGWYTSVTDEETRQTIKDVIARCNQGLVLAIVKKLGRWGKEMEDAAWEGLNAAIDRFDVSRGNKFSSFAWRYIIGYTLNALRGYSTSGRPFSVIRLPAYLGELERTLTEKEKQGQFNQENIDALPLALEREEREEERELLRYLREVKESVETSSSLDDPLTVKESEGEWQDQYYDDIHKPEDIYGDLTEEPLRKLLVKEAGEIIERAIASLSPRTAYVIERRFMSDKYKPDPAAFIAKYQDKFPFNAHVVDLEKTSLVQISREINLSKQRTSKLLKKGIEKLRVRYGGFPKWDSTTITVLLKAGKGVFDRVFKTLTPEEQYVVTRRHLHVRANDLIEKFANKLPSLVPGLIQTQHRRIPGIAQEIGVSSKRALEIEDAAFAKLAPIARHYKHAIVSELYDLSAVVDTYAKTLT